jgi:hypothetical protein
VRTNAALPEQYEAGSLHHEYTLGVDYFNPIALSGIKIARPHAHGGARNGTDLPFHCANLSLVGQPEISSIPSLSISEVTMMASKYSNVATEGKTMTQGRLLPAPQIGSSTLNHSGLRHSLRAETVPRTGARRKPRHSLDRTL